jgi:curli biogenesis system outer membrane secretion channel CsgG
MLNFKRIGSVCALSVLSACATVADAPIEIPLADYEAGQAAQAALETPQEPLLKRKIAIGRFSNETRYGKALLYDGERDPLADQAADMLANRLFESHRFIVLERPDLYEVLAEKRLQGDAIELPGVDVLVVGSVTEFGRKTEGRSGFLSSTKRQVATASVEARIIDVRTGAVIFSAKGSAASSVETGEVAGFGSRAAYDSSLNDSALDGAIADLMNDFVSRLSERRWSTDVLYVENGRVFISGGQSQGIRPGAVFSVEKKGKTIMSGQTGFPITLPGERVAQIEILSLFGEDTLSEGAISRVISGQLPSNGWSDLIVVESKQ